MTKFKPYFAPGEMALNHTGRMYVASSPFRMFRAGLKCDGNYLAFMQADYVCHLVNDQENKAGFIHFITMWDRHWQFKQDIAERFAPGLVLH